MKNTICQKEGYTLYRPLNSQDMNYHFIDSERKDHLIDIEDIHDNEHDLEEHGGMLWGSLSTLEDIEECLEMAWKVIPANIEIF